MRLPDEITQQFLDVSAAATEEQLPAIVYLWLNTAHAFEHADAYARVERYARIEPALRRMARKLSGFDDGDHEREVIAGAIYLLRENGKDEGRDAIVEVLSSFGCEEAAQVVDRHWNQPDFFVRRLRVPRIETPLAEELTS